MKGTLEKAFGYRGDNLNLPVRDLAAALLPLGTQPVMMRWRCLDPPATE